MKYILQTYLRFVLLLLLLGSAPHVFAQYDIPPVPKVETSLYDYANVLTESQQQALENKLIRYADSTSTQIVMAIISTSKGEDLALLGAKWGQKWGIGQKDKDNGILVLLAKDDRKIDINTGYGIEYRMSDRDAERIINRVMIPQFKSGNYYGGLDGGADAIFAALMGEFTEDRDFSDKGEGTMSFVILIALFIFFIIILRSRNNRGGGSGGRRQGASLLDVIILSNMGRTGGFGTGGFGGGSSGGSFGGGGFGGGFGGGGFGGGGASGGW